MDNPVKMVVSGKKKKFACHICGKEYNTKQYVKQHVKSIHKQDGKSPITVTIDSKTLQTQFPNNLNGLVGNGQESQVRFHQLDTDITRDIPSIICIIDYNL